MAGPTLLYCLLPFLFLVNVKDVIARVAANQHQGDMDKCSKLFLSFKAYRGLAYFFGQSFFLLNPTA